MTTVQQRLGKAINDGTEAQLDAEEQEVLPLKHFLDLYKTKCDHFGEDPNPEIYRTIADSIESK